MRAATWTLALVVLPVLGAAAPLTTPACPDGALAVPVPGQGWSCRVDGGWLVLTAGGGARPTHGPDPPAAAVQGTAPGVGHQAPPLCVADPTTQRHAVAVYTRPSDKLDTYAAAAPSVRREIAKANALLREESHEFALTGSYVFACDADGRITVLNVVLPISQYADDYGAIASALWNLGYRDPLVKYWIFYADRVPCSCGGQSEIGRLDSGPTYSIVYSNGLTYEILAHENGHGLGAVRLDAPHSTGAWHCTDGSDVMCYDDGGRNEYIPLICVGMRFDCNHDDYFNPQPLAGSYLAQRPDANLASPANLYIRLARLDEIPEAPRNLTATPGPARSVVLAWSPSAEGSTPLVGYRVYRQWATPGIENLATVPPGVTSWTDVTPPPAAGTYWVTAVNERGESLLSLPAVEPQR